MRPLEYFFARTAALEASLFEGAPRGGKLAPEDRGFLLREFTRLAAPVLGASAAEDLGRRTLERLGEAPGGLGRLRGIAAFVLGEDDGSFPLEREDWEDIRETLEEVSGEIDLSVLTALMGELLRRGKLKADGPGPL